jgi:hypothetical protein
MVAWGIPVALAASSVIGSLLSDSGGDAEDVARIQAPRAYPGQKGIAKMLAPYLWENIDVGLTEKEKNLYRGEGLTGILQGAKGARRTASRTAASQGLRGGSIANILSDITESTIPARGKLESTIMTADILRKRKRIQDILAFLNLKAGYGEDIESDELTAPINSIQQIIQDMGFPGADLGQDSDGGYDPGIPGVIGGPI